MPLKISLKDLKRGDCIMDVSSWKSIFHEYMILSDETMRNLKCFSYSDVHEWRYIQSIIKNKLWVAIKRINGKTMRLYFTNFWFDESRILNVESITYEEAQEIVNMKP